MTINFMGAIPESWHCVDCGKNTAPGCLNRADAEKAAVALGDRWGKEGINQTVCDQTELFSVRDKVWKASGMQPMGGCLCIRCIEKRLGRQLRPKDFERNHAFNDLEMLPGTPLRQKRLRGKR